MIENLDQNQIIFLISIMALTAIPVGFVAGLFGIGGGLITVPFLFYIFGILGFDQDYLMHLAVGTSFAIIIPTSLVSVITHHKFKAVDFEIVKSYGLFVITGVILGAPSPRDGFKFCREITIARPMKARTATMYMMKGVPSTSSA